MQTNIETIYQQHIKPLSHDEQLKLLAKMAEELANGKKKMSNRKSAVCWNLKAWARKFGKELTRRNTSTN